MFPPSYPFHDLSFIVVLVAASGDYRTDAGFGSEFLYRDFRPLWQAGIDRSKEMGLYRQNYCACIFSEYERFEKKLRKLSAE